MNKGSSCLQTFLGKQLHITSLKYLALYSSINKPLQLSKQKHCQSDYNLNRTCKYAQHFLLLQI